MVLVTCEQNTAPKNSNTPARTTAYLMVRALDPTEVAKALATSLAPIPKAANKAPKAPTMTIHRETSVVSGARIRSSYMVLPVSSQGVEKGIDFWGAVGGVRLGAQQNVPSVAALTISNVAKIESTTESDTVLHHKVDINRQRTLL